ncbi:uncharacterized protein EAF02_005524 [Botrytis sinoallii]|uniref:uncharacterized protein n=1 Tax=Botrytis sinoallii TaxID=1463999 RepID=UPI001901ADAF|nr:uncharacterized protein EAF02_005524 [Botrytis sinoallii]KAF7883604.1 hypothetical protein EAF02_005524 [Botrytis sinoallii]
MGAHLYIQEVASRQRVQRWNYSSSSNDKGKPNNRENPPPPFALLSGYSPLYLSPIAGTPEVTAPIGEITYSSQTTQREEPLQISVLVVSCPGTDLDFIDLVHEALKTGGKPIHVAVGRSILGYSSRDSTGV